MNDEEKQKIIGKRIIDVLEDEHFNEYMLVEDNTKIIPVEAGGIGFVIEEGDKGNGRIYNTQSNSFN